VFDLDLTAEDMDAIANLDSGCQQLLRSSRPQHGQAVERSTAAYLIAKRGISTSHGKCCGRYRVVGRSCPLGRATALSGPGSSAARRRGGPSAQQRRCSASCGDANPERVTQRRGTQSRSRTVSVPLGTLGDRPQVRPRTVAPIDLSSGREAGMPVVSNGSGGSNPPRGISRAHRSSQDDLRFQPPPPSIRIRCAADRNLILAGRANASSEVGEGAIRPTLTRTFRVSNRRRGFR
jgi:hypothetical protein